MPRYYFHAEDGRYFPDEIGSEFPNLDTAKIEAVKILGELLKEDAQDFWKTESMRLTVTNETGLTLFILDTSAIISPLAAPRPRPRPRPKA